jgi:hypothetical protein
MAQQTGQQKQSVITRLLTGREGGAYADSTPGARLPGTRWQTIRYVLGRRFGALVKLNFLMLMFTLPLIGWIFLSDAVMGGALAGGLPYNANYGIGYPGVTDLAAQYGAAAYANSVTFVLVMLPCALVAVLGFAGGFHAVRQLIWEEDAAVGKRFWRGVRRNALRLLPAGLPVAGAAALFVWYISASEVNGTPVFLRVLTFIGAGLLLLFVFFFFMYYSTHGENYQTGAGARIKAAAVLSVAMIAQNIPFAVLGLLPAGFLLLPLGSFSMIAFVIFFLFGIAFTSLVWTVFAQSVYDKFITPPAEPAVKGTARKK